jgi:hypothetical protein
MLKTNHAFGWIESAWGLFIQQPIKWILLILIALLISSLTLNLITPFFMAGVAFACHTQYHGNLLKIQHLFVGFRQALRSLFSLCLIYLVALIVFYLAIELPIRSYIAQHASASGLFIVLLFACQLLFSVSFLASTLVILNNKTAVEAAKIAIKIMAGNVRPILMLNFMLSVAIVLMFLLIQQLGIGLLFITKALFLLWFCIALILFCSSLYYAYQDLFLKTKLLDDLFC